ncbi:MAG TPA: ATP-binding protein [Usitatibacter sp.]|nr:ATP-binding protein [Usitatibacter sp.]
MNTTSPGLVRRILLVEDSADDAELLGFALRTAPFTPSLRRVETEADFAAALDDAPPDVILCDYHLPRFSMTRALQIVREERGLDVPFIVVSRLIGEEAAVDAMQRGANDYLLKGRLGRLGAAIEAALERNAARREALRAQEALRRIDLLNRSLLNSISMRIAVLDARGVVVAANRAWREFHRAAGGEGDAVGVDYLAQLAAGEDLSVAETRAGIESVMKRLEPRYAIEYERAGRGGARWEMLRAEPLEDSEHGAVVSVEDVTPRIMSRLALQDALQRVQRISKRLLTVQEEERRALALELHDDLGQSLAAQKIALHQLRERLAATAEAEPLRACQEITDDILARVRGIAYALRPPQLDQLGLAAALQALARAQREATGVEVECRCAPLPQRPPMAVENACFRIAQEALNNATRHGRATQVVIEVEVKDRILRLAVRDNGVGFEEAEASQRAVRSGSLGLIGMAERAELAGGRLRIRSVAGAGTTVSATFALDRPWGPE